MTATVRYLLAAVFLVMALPVFASEPETVTFEGSLKYQGKAVILSGELVRPQGDGPFPAVVLMHGCGGLSATVRHGLRKHARHLNESGFVALILDSFGPRNIATGSACETNDRLAAARVYRTTDALDAHAYLAALDFVDADNIFQMGQSNGASVSVRLAQRKDTAFRGAVAYYPWCGAFTRWVDRVDLTAPLLVFGGSADDWTPPAACAALKARGADYEVKIYPDAVHSFDLEIEHQRYQGHLVGYDRAATTDSRKQMLAFLRRHMTPELKQRMPQTAEAPPRQYLAGAEIRTLMPTGRLKGVNAYGNPYTISYTADGRMSGVAGNENEFKDTGKWWVKEDMFCRQYATWLNGTAACFRAVLDGGTISWYDAEGAFVSADRFER